MRYFFPTASGFVSECCMASGEEPQAGRDYPEGVALCAVEDDAPLPDRRLRDAWRIVDGAIVADAAAAAPILQGWVVTTAQRRLDALARAWGYDDCRACITYLGDPYPRFAAEAAAMRDWRSATWAYLDQQRDAADPSAVLDGLPPAPERPTV